MPRAGPKPAWTGSGGRRVRSEHVADALEVARARQVALRNQLYPLRVVLIVVVLLSVLDGEPTPGIAGRSLAITTSLALFVLAVLFEPLRQGQRGGRALEIVDLVAVGGAGVALAALQPHSSSSELPAAAAVFLAAMRLPPRSAGMVGLPVTIGLAIAIATGSTGAGANAQTVPGAVLLCAVVGALGVLVRQALLNRDRTELLLAELQDAREDQARAAASGERIRLARELHDSVSQALFSMTMHTRAAQLAMVKAGLADDTPLGRSIAELADLTRGAQAEMRALIFELRPAALAEEGLIAALGKQAAALSAREEVAITVEGPELRLDVSADVEEHLYRILSEALHNVVKHARAAHANVRVSAQAGTVRAVVCDDGAGFDTHAEHPGHLGLSTMAERATLIGGEVAVTSEAGSGTTVTVSLPALRPGQDRPLSPA